MTDFYQGVAWGIVGLLVIEGVVMFTLAEFVQRCERSQRDEEQGGDHD